MSNNSNTVQAFWIALGSLFSFGFAIVSSMILSRYFPKEDYGTYKQVLYVYTTLLTVFTLGLPKAFSFFLPRVENNQSKDLIKKITNIFFILGGFFSVFLFLFASQIAIFLKNQDLTLALKIFSPVPFLMLPTMGLEGILATFRKTKFLAMYDVITRLFMLFCVAIPVVFFDGGYIEAIIGFVIASFVSFLLALYFKYYPVKKYGNEKCNISYKEIFKFSLPLLYASLWGIIISSADQFFISRYFGSKVFAEFSNGAMELPFVGMIVGATSSVLSPVFSRMSHEKLDPQKDIFPIWKSVFEKSALLIYPLVIYSFFFADVLMVVLYGHQYEASSVYFKIKLILNFFTLIAYAPLIINIGKVKYYSDVHMYGALILIILEYLSILIFNSPYAISVVSLVCQIGRIFFMLFMVANFFNMKIYQLFPLRLIFKIIFPSVVILFLEHHILTYYFQFNHVLTLLVSFPIYGVVFCLFSILIKLDYLIIIEPLFQKLKK